MAEHNTLTALAPVLFSAMQTTPRELPGIVQAVNASFDDKGAGLNDTVKMPVFGAMASSTYTPAMTTTAGSAQTPSSVTLTLDSSEQVAWTYTGEEERSLMNGDGNMLEMLRQNTEQAKRTLVNKIDTACFNKLRVAASRAYGTAGVTPFASDFTAVSNTLKILRQNGFGIETGEISLVVDTDAYFKALDRLTINGNNSGSQASNIFKTGEFMEPVYGVKMRSSGNILAVTAGSGATTYAINGNKAIGSTTLTLKTGTATVYAGDIFSIASVADKYVATSELVGAGNITIAKPGLRTAASTNDVVTVNGTNFVPNLMIHKAAMALKVRPYTMPWNANIEQTVITDALSGLSFQFCKIYGDGEVTYRLQCVYGAAVIQGEAAAILLG